MPCLFRLPHPPQGCTWSCSTFQTPLRGATWKALALENRTLIPALTPLQKPLQTPSFLSLVTSMKVSSISHPRCALAAPAASPLPFCTQVLLFPPCPFVRKTLSSAEPQAQKSLAPAPPELLHLCRFGQEVSFPTSSLAVPWKPPPCTPRN